MRKRARNGLAIPGELKKQTLELLKINKSLSAKSLKNLPKSLLIQNYQNEFKYFQQQKLLKLAFSRDCNSKEFKNNSGIIKNQHFLSVLELAIDHPLRQA